MIVKSFLIFGALGSAVAAGSILFSGTEILPSGASRSRAFPQACQANGHSDQSAGCRAVPDQAGAAPRSLVERWARDAPDLPRIGQDDGAGQQPWADPDAAESASDRNPGGALALPADDVAETGSLTMLPPDEEQVSASGAAMPPASEEDPAMPPVRSADVTAVPGGTGGAATSWPKPLPKPLPKPEDRTVAKPANRMLSRPVNPPRLATAAIPDPVPKPPADPPARPPEAAKRNHPSGPQIQSDATRMRQNESDSRTFVATYLDLWSSSNDKAPADLQRLFAPQIRYFGKELDRQALLEAKRRVAERWPVRSYKPRPGTMNVQCEPQGAACTVRAMVDWQARNPARKTASSGAFAVELGLDVSGPNPLVRSETGLDATKSKAAERRGASRPQVRQEIRQEGRQEIRQEIPQATRQAIPQDMWQSPWQTEILPRPPRRLPDGRRPPAIIWEEDGIGWPFR